jgi:hypothetical protein
VCSQLTAPLSEISQWKEENYTRRKIRLIECNAKCRYLKNLLVKELCGWCFICLGPPPLL